MKIVYLLSGPSVYDGSTKSFMNLIGGLREKGVEPYIVCPSRKGVYEILKKQNYNALALKYSFSTKPGFSTTRDKFYFFPKLLRRFIFNNISQIILYFYCRKLSPDIIHTNTTALSIGYHVAKRLNIPHVWHIREYGDLDFHMNIRKVNNYILDANNYTISITKDIAMHRKVSDSINSQVIYNGIFNKSEINYTPHKDNFFLYAGRIQRAKGLKELVLAFIEFYASRPNCGTKLLIAEGVVDGAYKNVIEGVISENNIKDQIVWLGHRQDIGDLMRRSLAVVIPSIYEGFGRVMAEAMFNGALVIGRDTGGTKEQFDNGLSLCGAEIGLRFLTNEECADCLRSVLDNGIGKYEGMILNGQKTVSELYSNESYVEKVMNFYNKVLRDKT